MSWHKEQQQQQKIENLLLTVQIAEKILAKAEQNLKMVSFYQII